MNADLTKPRRDALANLMEANQMVILFAKPEPEGIEKYTQENNFLYFTGLQIPDAIFGIYKSAAKTSELLFIQRGIPEREVWDGKKMTIQEAKEISGIDSVFYLEDFYPTLSMYCSSVLKVWSNIGTPQLDSPLPYALHKLDPMRRIYPNILIENINNLVRPLRAVKSDWEIMQLQRAIDLTGKGIVEVMENTRAGMMEYELEALLFYHLQKKSVRNWGFAPIIAAGINAATLHYKTNDCQIKESDVVLLDVGASYMNYSADITRCFPVSGKFSPRQKEVYTEVLAIQKEIISMMKPGVGLTQLNEKTAELMGAALVRLGLITNESDYRRYYMHSIGHHLGMDTHDLGARDSVLAVGNVLTVEPGIYIPEENLGIRIEDDILITAEGYCILSQNIPKEIEEIEALCLAARS